MKMTPYKIVASLMIPFALAGCGDKESDNDIQRKPSVVNSIVADSLEKCDLTEPVPRDAPYEVRLRKVLSDSRTEALDYIQSNHITVCLDRRFPHQNSGAFDTRIEAIYYGGETGRVIALWDNGMIENGTGMFATDTSDNNPEFLNVFKNSTENGAFHLADKFTYGAKYACGKGCNKAEWRHISNFDKDSISKNSDLKIPPVKILEKETLPCPKYI